MDVEVEIHCAQCGSAHYSLRGGAADEAPIHCDDCGVQLGTIAELKAELLARALARSAEAMRAELERLGKGEAA